MVARLITGNEARPSSRVAPAWERLRDHVVIRARVRWCCTKAALASLPGLPFPVRKGFHLEAGSDRETTQSQCS
jgi:hypothetical protein